MDALVIVLFIALGAAFVAYAYRQNRHEQTLVRQHNDYVVATERFWDGKDEALAKARAQAEKHYSKKSTALNKREWALKLAADQLDLAMSEGAAGDSLLADVDAVVKR